MDKKWVYVLDADGRAEQMFCIFSHQENNPVFNLSAPRALGSSKGGLLWEINLDRSIFPKKNDKSNCKAVSFFAFFFSERLPLKNAS